MVNLSIDMHNAYIISGFFWTFQKNLNKKNSSKISEKLKQIIQKLNILPTRFNFFLQEAQYLIDFALKLVLTRALTVPKNCDTYDRTALQTLIKTGRRTVRQERLQP